MGNRETPRQDQEPRPAQNGGQRNHLASQHWSERRPGRQRNQKREQDNGERIEGESQIGHARRPIVRLGCIPERPPALPRAIEAIAHADLIVLGPGSLYTSLLPNLLVPELVEAIARSKAPRLYICNLMTQPGETDGLDVEGHLRAIEAQLASIGIDQRLFTAVLAQEDLPDSPLLDHYRQKGAVPVICDSRWLRRQGYTVMQAPLQGARPTATLRHDPRSLAVAVMRFYKQQRRLVSRALEGP